MTMQAPRGTQDILPDRSPAWEWVESRLREVLHRYGYAEIRTPLFEHTEVFQRSVGESTDIVQKEMYTFLDRKGRSMSLRPEGTAAVARAVVEHKLYASGQALKLFYLGPMFRYERPQAGRYRQHHQVGAELLGVEAPAADFELIALLVDLMKEVGLEETQVLLNSVGDDVCRPGFSDKLREYLRTRLADLCPDCVRRAEENPLRVLDCKVPGCQIVVRGSPSIQDHLCPACRSPQEELLGLLERAGIVFMLSHRLVRGLDYYTRTVFELQHTGLGSQNSVGGGGRYDTLVKQFDGPPTPGVGFSSGIERVLLALESEGTLLPGPPAPEVMVVVVGEGEVRRAGMVLARRLRSRFQVDLDLKGRSLAAQMKAANRSGARLVLLVGEGELADRSWTVKEMATGAQERVPDEGLESRLAEILAASSPQKGSSA